MLRFLLAVGGLLLLVQGAQAADLEWFAPDEAMAGHPMHAALVARDGSGGLAAHVDAEVQVRLDGVLLLETPSVHEHDGVHTLTFTPPHPGVLSLHAVGRDGAEAVHAVQVAPGADTWWGSVQAFAALGLEVDGASGRHGMQVAGPPGLPFAVLWDVRDAQGRMVLSAWSDGPHARGPVLVDPTYAAAVRAVLVSAPGGPVTLGSRVLDASVPGAGPSLLGLPGLPVAGAVSCPPDLVVTDPDSVGDARTWQEWTDVRVTHLGGQQEGPTKYSLVEWGVAEPTVLFDATATDPFGRLTFRAPGPGSYELHVWRGGDSCGVPFTVVPRGGPLGLLDLGPPDSGYGAEVVVDGGDVEVSLEVVGPDGDRLAHYEFDVRVVRPGAADGALVWQGKLHGHAGHVTLRLHGLGPGEHVVYVYASPQDLDTVPVEAGPGGVVVPFMVVGAGEGDAAPGGVAAPGGSWVFPVLAAAVLLSALRRRASP